MDILLFNPPMSAAALFESTLSNGFSKKDAEVISNKDEIILRPGIISAHL